VLKLIRNCSHRNEVATFYFEKDQEKSILKASSTRLGIEEIKQEIEGWVWYQSKRYPDVNKKICKIVENKENYIRIKIQYIEGCKEDYLKGLQRNSLLVKNVIRHYCDIWREKNRKTFPLHGDLSIDNVISNKDGVHIIDWEHFSPDAAPFGFDAYNLLFEQLWISMKGRKIPSKAELNIVLDNIRIIRSESAESSQFYDQPLACIRRFIKANDKIWRNCMDRLTVLYFSEERVSIIDEMIRSHI
jgi:hypothetical protein